MFKTIPVKKQGKYNLNVQLQDLGTTSNNYPKRLRIFRGPIVDSRGFILMSDGSAESLYDSREKN